RISRSAERVGPRSSCSVMAGTSRTELRKQFRGQWSVSGGMATCFLACRAFSREQDAAAYALDQQRIDGAAPPAQRPLLASFVPDDQQVDVQRVDEPRDDFDRLTVEQVRRHRKATFGETRRCFA